MKDFKRIIIGCLCLSIAYSPVITVTVRAAVLEKHRCGSIITFSSSQGSIGCDSNSVGPNAPCVGSVKKYPYYCKCESVPELTYLTCTEQMIKYTEHYGVATEGSTALWATCMGLPVVCVGCGLAAIAAGMMSAGGGYVIGAGICSVIGCAGLTFFNPAKCCYTTCSINPNGIECDWKIGC